MIEVIDRIPTHPGRVKLTPVDGQENIFDMVRADAPVEPGTPLNKALFDSMRNYIYDAVQAIDNKVFEFSQWAEVGSLPDGSSFGLYENGILTQYIKLKDNYEGTGRPLVIRRHVTHQDTLYAQKDLYYETAVDSWLNGDFLTRFDDATKNAISAVPIDVVARNDTMTQVSRRVFILSLPEYQSTNSYMPRNGDPVAVFSSDEKRIALYNGVPVAQHTRSSDYYFEYFGVITVTGTNARLSANTVAGIRPAFTFPANFNVVVASYSTANVNATAEVI